MTNTPIAKVFLDTVVLKAARDSQNVLLPFAKELDWGHCKSSITVHEIVYKNQNVKVLGNNPEAFKNRLLNRLVARLAKDKEIELLVSDELRFEAMGVPAVDFSFFRSPQTKVRSPVHHFGLVIDGTRKDHLYDALKSITDTRFLELQKLTGAYQGTHREPNRNQLIDAYHLWCAETAGADYFLTHDDKLVRLWSKSQFRGSCTPINTIPLLRALVKHRFRLFWPMLSEAWSIRRSGRNLTRKFQRLRDVRDEFRDP